QPGRPPRRRARAATPARPRPRPSVRRGSSGTRRARAERRQGASGSGLGPDDDHAAAGVAPFELAWCLRRATVDLDPLDVVGWRMPSEIRRRLYTVDEILGVTTGRRPHHLRDAIVRQAYLLHPAHHDQDV